MPDSILRRFVIESGGDTGLLVVRLTDTMTYADVERFMRRHGGRIALSQRRLAERREAVRALVAFYPKLTSGHQIAAAIECDLVDLVSGNESNQAAAHQGFSKNGSFAEITKTAALARVLDLSRGDPPGFETIRHCLAGIGKDDE
jgi:hypothetical protein